MKKQLLTIITLAFIGLSNLIEAQAPNWQWAKGAGGSRNDLGRSIAVDGSGNTYSTGSFRSSSITFGSTTLTNADNTGNTDDLFIVKYNASGNVVWAKSAGGNSDDNGYSIAVDGSGNVYIAGTYRSSSITFGSTTLNNQGGNEVLIVKYNASGNAVWAKSAGGSGLDYGYGIALDGSGNSYITGSFRSLSIFFGSTTLTNAWTAGDDIFVAKYDANGNLLWAKSSGGSGDDESTSIAVDGSGNAYITGYFSSSSINFGSSTITNAGFGSTFTVKYNASGNAIWVKSAGGSLTDLSNNITVDGSGNSYITGYFTSPSITFGSTTLTNANSGNDDMFIAKYDTGGNAVWAKSAGASGDDDGYGIALDGSGNTYITGYFNSPTITFGSTTLTNAGLNDIFIAKYDASGNMVWAKSAGTIEDDYCYGIAVDGNDNTYITGYFYNPTITFGSTTLSNADNTVSTSDLFIAKLNTTTGIEEMQDEGGVLIYPNPASTEIRISDLGFRITAVHIYNVLGMLTKSEDLIGKRECVVNITELKSGVYFIQVTTNNQQLITKKIVKE